MTKQPSRKQKRILIDRALSVWIKSGKHLSVRAGMEMLVTELIDVWEVLRDEEPS